ncbi:MAG TPA: KH domain-containing protein [Vicinamibacteria bacterium]|nr:KH domain-containing protein [Vicinamibacteria bacterium]
MRDLVSHLACGLVREPGRVRVHEHVEHGRTVIELSVAPLDRGRVIGREGRTANAMRTLLDALAERRGDTVSLEIVD